MKKIYGAFTPKDKDLADMNISRIIGERRKLKKGERRSLGIGKKLGEIFDITLDPYRLPT